MDSTEADTRALESIKGSTECPKGFACCRPGGEGRAATRALAGGRVIECLEDKDKPCRFAVDFGLGRFCECPVLAVLLKGRSRLPSGRA